MEPPVEHLERHLSGEGVWDDGTAKRARRSSRLKICGLQIGEVLVWEEGPAWQEIASWDR